MVYILRKKRTCNQQSHALYNKNKNNKKNNDIKEMEKIERNDEHKETNVILVFFSLQGMGGV